MRKIRQSIGLSSLVLLGVVGIAAGCNSDDDDAALGVHPTGVEGGTTAVVGAGVITSSDGSMSLKGFSPPADPGGGGILVTASGETLALSGFKFPPDDPANDTYMVDGWNFTLTEYITVFDNVTLWNDPNTVPSDQSQHGSVAAHATGPWVADLHKGGVIPGKGGGGEEATAITAIAHQDDGSPFDSTVTYGFGFSTVAAPADYDAINVNLDSSESDDYAFMVQNGYSVLYVGTATFMGTSCTQTSVPGETNADGGAGYDFSRMPKTINFRLGFSTPTNYVNCQNGTDFQNQTGLSGEDHPRGVQVLDNESIQAQVTIHMDHPFWESFAENSPLHWDQIAGQYVGATSTPEAHTEDFRGLSFLSFTDKTGAAIPWRNCAGTFYTPAGNGQMNFDPLSVPVNPAASDPSQALRDYYDYIRYTQSTQGHLNSQGLCFISRQYPAPGGGSGN
jgi:hypothetical protein